MKYTIYYALLLSFMAMPTMVHAMDGETQPLRSESLGFTHEEQAGRYAQLTHELSESPNLHLVRAIEALDIEKVRALLQNPAVNVNYQESSYFEELKKRFVGIDGIDIDTAMTELAIIPTLDRVPLAIAIHMFQEIRSPMSPIHNDKEKLSEADNKIEEIMKLLLTQKGIDPNLAGDAGRTPLYAAIDSPAAVRERVVSMLLGYQDNEAKSGKPLDLNKRGGNGETPFAYALSQGRWGVATLLFNRQDHQIAKRHGASLDHPLHTIARERGHCKNNAGLPAQQLFLEQLERGAPVNVPRYTFELEGDGSGHHAVAYAKSQNPFDVALASNNLAIGPLMLACGGRPSKPGAKIPEMVELASVPTAYVPLWYLWHGDPKTEAEAENILQKASTNGAVLGTSCPVSYLTPCMIAAARGQLPFLKTLKELELGCDLNAQTPHGWTALHFAGFANQPETIHWLLSQPHIIPFPRLPRRAWMAAQERGLTPLTLAYIGAQLQAQVAKEQSGHEWQQLGMGGDQIPTHPQAALLVLAEFNHRRCVAFLSMKAYIRDDLKKDVPKEIVRRLAASYRFDEEGELCLAQINSGKKNDNALCLVRTEEDTQDQDFDSLKSSRDALTPRDDDSASKD